MKQGKGKKYMSYKVSDNFIFVVEKIAGDFKKKDYQIRNAKELKEFGMILSMIVSASTSKRLQNQDTEGVKKVKAALEELEQHQEDVDLDDLNSRLSH